MWGAQSLNAPCSLAGDDLEVMSEATYDQLSVPRSLFGPRAAYLKEGSPLLLLFADDGPVAGASCPAHLSRLDPRYLAVCCNFPVQNGCTPSHCTAGSLHEMHQGTSDSLAC